MIPIVGRPGPIRRTEAGSAYMIVISALAVLSLVGLAVIAVSQTEFQIGAAERLANPTFYAADSAVGVATAQAVVSGNYQPITFSAGSSSSIFSSGHKVSTSPFYKINSSPCNLCDINDESQYGGQKHYRKVNHALTTTATRQSFASGILNTSLQANATKQVAVMIEIQPWEDTNDSSKPANDPAQLALIKF